MIGNANRKEQAIALLGGNGLVLVHVVTTIRDGDVPSIPALGALATMGVASVMGLWTAYIALAHAEDGNKDFGAWRAAALVALGISLATLFVWFLNISEIVQRTLALSAPH